MTFVILPPFIDSSAGIKVVATYNVFCHGFRHFLAIDIASTQRYLTLIPELLKEASIRFERYAMGGRHD